MSIAHLTRNVLAFGVLCLLVRPAIGPAAEPTAPPRTEVFQPTGGTPEQRFMQGLRDRRLFELAEKHCTDRLEHSELAEGERADFTIELARTFTEHAVESRPEQRGARWRAAADATAQFLRDHPRSGRALLVRAQAALTALTQGELARQEMELGAPAAQQQEGTRVALRAAVSALKALEADVAAELVARHRQTTAAEKAAAGQLSAGELTSLESNVRYQLARAYRNQGLCYEAMSADRINALSQSIELLKKLEQGPLDDALYWSVRLDQAACLRLLGDATAAAEKLAAIEAEQPAPAIAARVRAERIRGFLAAAEIDAALAVVAEPQPAASWADGDLAELEAVVAAWQRAAGQQNAATKQFERQAVALVRHLEERHGPYWMRRGERLLAGSIAAGAGGENAEALTRAAESYYRAGQMDEALLAYDRAAKQAATSGDAERALDLALTAAAIESARQHFRAAATRYRQAAIAAREHAKAPEAHLLAVYNTAQAAAAEKSAQLDDYAAILQQHLQTWPDDATSSQAAWWLGKLQDERREWLPAVESYRRVPPTHAQYLAALEATARCYQRAIDDLSGDAAERGKLLKSAASYFETVIVGPEERLPEKWSPAARSASLAAARLWLAAPPDGLVRAQQILSAALDGAADAPAQWKATARTLLVSSLAGQGNLAAAGKVLDKLSASSPQDLLELVDGLSQAAGSLGVAPDQDQARSQFAELELRAVKLLEARRAELSPAQQQDLARTKALALADAGHRAEALTALRPLAQQYPSDGKMQEQFAALLAQSRQPDELKAALALWVKVQDKSRVGSARWFRACYAVAEVQYGLGRKSQARSTIKLTAATHPDLGGDALRARFEQLLAKCEK